MCIACPLFISGLDPELCRTVDHYCERNGPEFDAEPINALSNLAFLVAGFVAWRRMVATRGDGSDGLVKWIVLTIPVVGLGSFLFHTIAVRWAEWGDVIPILVFMLLYLWLVARRFLDWSPGSSGLALAAFFAVTFYLEAEVPGTVLWGGALYLPTVLILIAVGTHLARERVPAGRPFLGAVGVFLLSFTARTLDAQVCEVFPIGTHFLWHLLNALLLFLLARIAILHAPRTHLGIRPGPVATSSAG